MKTVDKRFIRALNGEALPTPPFWLMRQAGRYLPEYRKVRANSRNFLDFCYTPDLAVEVTLQPLRRYGFDAAILFSDILVIPDALGQKVAFKEGEGPVLEPIRSADDVTRLGMEGLHEHLNPVYETVSRLASSIPKTTTLIGFSGAPWTLASYMVEGHGSRDFATVRAWAFEGAHENNGFSDLISLLVDAVSDYLIAQIQHGAEALQLFDTWAGVLSPSQFERWVIEPTAEIVRRVKAAHPGTPIIGFPRGAGILYPDFVKRTGVNGVSLDNGVPVDWASSVIQPMCTVQGNLDNMALLAGGAALETEAAHILDTLSGGPFIFNLGHGILPQTPPEHVARLAEIIRGRNESG